MFALCRREHRVISPPELLPYGVSSYFFLLVNDFDVLSDNMLGDLGNQMDKLNILAEVMKGFDPMIVFEIAIHQWPVLRLLT